LSNNGCILQAIQTLYGHILALTHHRQQGLFDGLPFSRSFRTVSPSYLNIDAVVPTAAGRGADGVQHAAALVQEQFEVVLRLPLA
jgi:hypothetical protein